MYYPPIKTISQSRLLTENFYGYNHNLRCDDGFFYDEKNISADNFPILSQRKKRGTVQQLTSAKGLLAKDNLAYIDGTSLYYNNYLITSTLDSLIGERQMVSMGAYLCIFPDGYYLNTKNLNDKGYMGSTFTTTTTVTFAPCNIEGSNYTYTYSQATQPTNPSNGQYWLDTSGSTHVLKQYSQSSNMWVEIPTVYTKISSPNIGKSFKVYDGVKISGCNYTGDINSIKEQIKALNNTSVLWAKGDNYIVVVGLLDQTVTQSTAVTVAREIPQMDYVIESNNRLWGCYYGMKGSDAVNEIYACKLGDFTNWNCFMGISTDSYAVSLGTDGVFTGAVNHLGKPLFFKENFIHKIYGNTPSSYQLATTECRGVQQGSYKSLVVVNETLFYKSRSDVVAYDGSLPTGISEAFGDNLYKDAVAGTVGGIYYISMKDSSNAYHLFSYDTVKGIWHKEDNESVKQFATLRDELYYITNDNKLKTIKGSAGTLESDIEWMVETGMIGYDYPDQKYLSRFVLRMSLGAQATFKLYIQYDSDGEWILKADEVGTGVTQSFQFPIVPARCDHMRIKMLGTGECKIFSFAKYLEVGSEITHDN